MASLGLVRILLLMHSAVTVVLLFSVEFRKLVKLYVHSIVTVQVFLEFCSVWWGTVLCVFYCVKITNYSNRLFIKLKMRISGMVPWLLLGSMVVSLFSSLPYGWCVYSLHKVNSTQIYNGTSREDIIVHTNHVRVQIIVVSGFFVPFLIFCVANFFLVVPLVKHTRNMSNTNTGFTKDQLDVYLNAIRNMFSCLIFYILYFINRMLMPLSVQLNNNFFSLVCCFFLVAYPSLHSVLLIISNIKLKQSIIDALHCLK
ncbi:taste receptor type 2 member 39-like [Rana temporaria]|uniref:taste receptor type 2 member 39-like n=1 Tax=Rana temporaria TaxID=8407 RepID=UPI001AACF0A1|nr:taste receptor type 2 member 39-like [Rana temporaria]